MTDKGLFLQNVIALIWDFDRTLSPHNMQRPIFDEFGIEEDVFWEEVRNLPTFYAKAGVRVQEDTCYLGHLLAYVKHGRMPGLTNSKLRELGGRIQLFAGLPEAFGTLQGILKKQDYADGDLRLEHYIVSTGLEEMIAGTPLADYVKGIWASRFIECPAIPGQDFSASPGAGEISQIAGFLDNTTKTRAIFEINKGVNVLKSVSVNDDIPHDQRRVPFRNMVYIADGPSDIPSFSVVRQHRGLAYAVYDPESDHHLEQAVSLQDAGRVDSYGPADYRQDSHTIRWLRVQIEKIARRIMAERNETTRAHVRPAPTH